MFFLDSEESLAPTAAVTEQEGNTAVAARETAELQFIS